MGARDFVGHTAPIVRTDGHVVTADSVGEAYWRWVCTCGKVGSTKISKHLMRRGALNHALTTSREGSK